MVSIARTIPRSGESEDESNHPGNASFTTPHQGVLPRHLFQTVMRIVSRSIPRMFALGRDGEKQRPLPTHLKGRSLPPPLTRYPEPEHAWLPEIISVLRA